MEKRLVKRIISRVCKCGPDSSTCLVELTNGEYAIGWNIGWKGLDIDNWDYSVSIFKDFDDALACWKGKLIDKLRLDQRTVEKKADRRIKKLRQKFSCVTIQYNTKTPAVAAGE